MRKPRIAVVGSVNIDMTFKVEAGPRPGETVLGSDLSEMPGGKGANQAVAAKRLGADVAFVGSVGDDENGRKALRALDAEALDLRCVRRASHEATGVALVMLEGSENRIVVIPGANGLLGAEDVEAAEGVIRSADAVLLQQEIPPEAVLRAIEIASRHGVPVVLNPAPAVVIPGIKWGSIFAATPNETEAGLLSGIDAATPEACAEACRLLESRGVKFPVVTRGGEGAMWRFDGKGGRQPAFPTAVVDTTAAGDTFSASLALSIASGLAPAMAVRRACAASAIKVGRMGRWSALPTEAEVDAFLEINKKR
jgi:ribokinase